MLSECTWPYTTNPKGALLYYKLVTHIIRTAHKYFCVLPVVYLINQAKEGVAYGQYTTAKSVLMHNAT